MSEPIVAIVIEPHSKVDIAAVEVDNQMAIIQVQVGKNIVEDVLLDGGASVNIIIENLRTKLGLPKPRLAPYHPKMANQSTTRPLGIIRNLKIHIHGIPYVATITILQNSVVDSNYFMLLGRPWVKDAKVTHDCGNDVIIVQINGTIKTISINKKLGAKTRRPQILVCYDLLEGLIDEEEDLIFEREPKLFSISTITISNEIISLLNIGMSEIRINAKSDLEQETVDQGVTEVVPLTTKTTYLNVKPKISL
jgi:hypothetical protein